jgi:hypothetical protein
LLFKKTINICRIKNKESITTTVINANKFPVVYAPSANEYLGTSGMLR